MGRERARGIDADGWGVLICRTPEVTRVGRRGQGDAAALTELGGFVGRNGRLGWQSIHREGGTAR